MDIKPEATAFLKYHIGKSRVAGNSPYIFTISSIGDYLLLKNHPDLSKKRTELISKGNNKTQEERHEYSKTTNFKRSLERDEGKDIEHFLSNFGYTRVDQSHSHITEKGIELINPPSWTEANKQFVGIIIGSIFSIAGGFLNSYLDNEFWSKKIKYIQLEKERGPEFKKMD
jgi:hypothetical protein